MGEKVDFDSILEQIGYFGKWQKRIFFYLSFTSFAAGLLVVVYTFTAFDTKYMCNIPQCELNYNGSHWLSKEESRLIPTPGKCQYYELEEGLTCSQYLDSIDPATSQRANCSGSDLVFDNSYVKSSLSKFDFIQQTFRLLQHLNSFYFKSTRLWICLWIRIPSQNLWFALHAWPYCRIIFGRYHQR